ncbi:type III-B CRISPR module-associated protein Cmr3 [Fervidobacterium sp.]
MFFSIEPFDTLFFRDARPFTMGVESWALQVFPPYPSTIFGAVRTWLIELFGGLDAFKRGEMHEWLGTVDSPGNLRILDPLIMQETAYGSYVYFPAPKDVLKTFDRTFKLGLLKNNAIALSNSVTDCLLINNKEEDAEEVEGFLELSGIYGYLNGEDVSPRRFKQSNEIYITETKTGIKKDPKTKVSEESFLYRIPMIRLKEGYKLLIGIEGIEKETPDHGFLKLGGESKFATIRKLTDFHELDDIQRFELDAKDKVFKIYLATPAIFSKGWIPEWIDDISLTGTYNGIELKLLGAVIGKFRTIGGWNIAKKQPKEMYRVVPEGSVYYFEVINDVDVQRIVDTFHFKNISDKYKEQGWGLSFVGRVK